MNSILSNTGISTRFTRVILGLLTGIITSGLLQASPTVPEQPLGVEGAMGPLGKAFTLIWEPVKRKADGTLLETPAGYNVYRRDSLRGPATKINSFLVPIIVYADRTDGETFYYSIRAVDKNGNESKDSYLIDSSRETNTYYLAEDGVSFIKIPGHLSTQLLSSHNKYGVPLAMKLVENPAPSGSSIIRNIQFQFLRGDTKDVVSDFGFDVADIDINIGYNVINGQVVHGVPGAQTVDNKAITGYSPDHLSLYWNNGVSWIRIGGTNDPILAVMQIKSSNLGAFQLRAEAPSSTLTLSKGNVFPRVFTPNGDGFNDNVYFILENPNGAQLKGEIFDLDGGLVASLPASTSNSGFGSTLLWDGNDSSGSLVTSGEYIYRIKGEDKSITGTLSVAR